MSNFRLMLYKNHSSPEGSFVGKRSNNAGCRLWKHNHRTWWFFSLRPTTGSF